MTMAALATGGFSQVPITGPTKTDGGQGQAQNKKRRHQHNSNNRRTSGFRPTDEKRTSTSGVINDHEYVDLGLPSGLKWATCNVGASSPSDFGGYFAWGETCPQARYVRSECTASGKRIPELRNAGIIDDSDYLVPDCDAAYANWGAPWRMPTVEEVDELREECKWKWTSLDGVKGYTVTGTNGNSIFLPAAGWIDGTSIEEEGESGYYWSSSPDEDNSYNANFLLFHSEGVDTSNYNRYYGWSVRPVSD